MENLINKIINADCLDILKTIPDNSIDMVWTDPPFGHNNHNGDFNSTLNKHRGIKDKPIINDDQESMRFVVSGMFDEAARFLKQDCCCCCCCCCGGGGPKPTFAWVANRMDSNGLAFFHSVIWDKKNPGLGWRYRRQHEMIMVAHRTGGKLSWLNNDTAQRNIISIFPPDKTNHPNEKPVELVKLFISLHTKPNDLIIDPFAGSCTTAIACHQLGRRFICIEKEKEYCDIGNRRLAEAQAQTELFPLNTPPQEQLKLL